MHLALIVLAVWLFKERAMFLDNSFFLFEIVRNADFTIQRFRFVSGIPQVLPLAAVKAALSLKWVLIAYSLSFALYHFVFYIICGSVLKNYRLALAALLMHTLMLTHTFYWGLSELLLGLSMMVPVFALLIENDGVRINNILRGVLLAIGIFLVGFSHPLIVLPFMFTAGFIWISKDIKVYKPMYIAACVYFLLVMFVKAKFFIDAYETGSTGQLLKHLKSLFPHYLSTYSNTKFFANVVHIYYWLPVVFLLVLGVYIYKRHWLKLVFVFISVIGFLQVVNISYPGAHTPDFYRENMYIPMCLILALPFVYDVIPLLNKRLVYVLFALIIGTAFLRINNQRDFYTGRVEWYRGYIAQNGDKKIMASFPGKFPEGTMIMSWASVYEFWMLSTLETGKTASIIIDDNIEQVSWAKPNFRSFVTIWGVFEYEDLNRQYFILNDSVSHYELIE